MDRYYLHGDAHEALEGRYYCRGCDTFEGRDHFEVCPSGKRRLEASELRPEIRERWRVVAVDRRGVGRVYRPDPPRPR